MIYKTGQILVILSLSLLFVAYSNFAPISLGSEQIADYVKNHFVREIIFGITLTIWAIKLVILPKDKLPFMQVVILGSVVIFPFWIAVAFGWSLDGLAEVWGKAINASTAYILHGVQVGMFLLGLLLIRFTQISDKDHHVEQA